MREEEHPPRRINYERMRKEKEMIREEMNSNNYGNLPNPNARSQTIIGCVFLCSAGVSLAID